MKNEKGFTLVELIVVIAILGVILILALPQVQKIQSQNKRKKYETYQESLEDAAKLYMDSNARDIFGNNESGCVTVYYSDLKKSNLIKDFGDSDVSCSDDATTFVEVRKENNNYKYASAIKCVDTEGNVLYEDKDILEDEFNCDYDPDKVVPNMSVTPESSGWIKQDDLHIKIEITDTSGLNRNIGILYYWTDPDGNKTSEDYIYNYANKEGVTKISYTIPTKHVPSETGDYNLVIRPYSSKNTNGIQDVFGNERKSVETYGIYKLDNTPPTCTETEGTNSSWINQSLTVTQHCADSESGCRQPFYQVPFSSTTKIGIITIEDNVGNQTDCEVDVFVDTDRPSCGAVSGDSTTWQNTDRNITVQCGDGEGSGCAQPSYTQYFSSEGATDVINISDTAGNTNSCTVNKYIDKTAPSISLELRMTNSGNYFSTAEAAWNNWGIFCAGGNRTQFLGVRYSAYDNLSGVNAVYHNHWYKKELAAKGCSGNPDTRKTGGDWSAYVNFVNSTIPNTVNYGSYDLIPRASSIYGPGYTHFLQCNSPTSSNKTGQTGAYFAGYACDNAGNCSRIVYTDTTWQVSAIRQFIKAANRNGCG